MSERHFHAEAVVFRIRQGYRSPHCQHSGMDSHGGVGRGYPKSVGGVPRLVDCVVRASLYSPLTAFRYFFLFSFFLRGV